MVIEAVVRLEISEDVVNLSVGLAVGCVELVSVGLAAEWVLGSPAEWLVTSSVGFAGWLEVSVIGQYVV